MKHTIIGIVVCMLMVATVLPAAGAREVHPTVPLVFGRITVHIVATVTDVSDSENLLGGAIQVGDTMTGKYTYNTRVQDSAPSYPKIGYYQFTSVPYGFEMMAGGFVFKTDPNTVDFEIWVYDNIDYYGPPPFDMFHVVSDKNLALSNKMSVDIIFWELGDTTGTALSSIALPTSAPVLTDWDRGMGLVIQGKDPSDSHKSYTLYAYVIKATMKSTIASSAAGYNSRAPSVTSYASPRALVSFWMNVLQRHPHAFPILRYVAGC